MKKRMYRITSKRKRLIDEALTTVRETREILDPELLEKAREVIGNAAQGYQDEQFSPMQAERVPVDCKKNLTIVMKFLEQVPENKALHREISSFLSEC